MYEFVTVYTLLMLSDAPHEFMRVRCDPLYHEIKTDSHYLIHVSGPYEYSSLTQVMYLQYLIKMYNPNQKKLGQYGKRK